MNRYHHLEDAEGLEQMSKMFGEKSEERSAKRSRSEEPSDSIAPASSSTAPPAPETAQIYAPGSVFNITFKKYIETCS